MSKLEIIAEEDETASLSAPLLNGAVIAAQVVQFARLRVYDKILELFAEHPKPSDLDCWALDDDGGTLLHQIMVHRPPAALVDVIISRMMVSHATTNTIPEDTTNYDGKTPLHIAVASGCSFAVIRRLTNGTILHTPVLSRDHQHRLPLHWACTNPHGIQRLHRVSLLHCGGRVARAKDNMIEVIDHLLHLYPYAVWARDTDGNTPYDLAVAHSIDPQILAMLQLTMKNFMDIPNTEKAEGNDTFISTMCGVTEVSPDAYECEEDISSIGSRGASTGPSWRYLTQKLRFSQVAL